MSTNCSHFIILPAIVLEKHRESQEFSAGTIQCSNYSTFSDPSRSLWCPNTHIHRHWVHLHHWPPRQLHLPYQHPGLCPDLRCPSILSPGHPSVASFTTPVLPFLSSAPRPQRVPPPDPFHPPSLVFQGRALWEKLPWPSFVPCISYVSCFPVLQPVSLCVSVAWAWQSLSWTLLAPESLLNLQTCHRSLSVICSSC